MEAQFPSEFVEPWLAALNQHSREQQGDLPDYFTSDPSSLITVAVPKSITVGSGLSVFTETLLPALLTARREILFVTCFWAESETLASFRDTLEQLASGRTQSSPKLRVRICLSSRSALQKLFHTSSRNGYQYPPSKWPSLGLPAQDDLARVNIDLQVKSLFFLPFSVMHPKFVIVDRRRAWMPSCNVSWETWFEGCISFEGDAVARLLIFYQGVWGSSDEALPANGIQDPFGGEMDARPKSIDGPESEGTERVARTNLPHRRVDFNNPSSYPAILLPSPHHRNPHLRLPFLPCPPPPHTPLNTALLTLFSVAQHKICILTPNLTCRAAIDGLLDALSRGVDVSIRTSRRMMLLEQLVTAQTTNEWCIDGMVREYERMRNPKRKRRWYWPWSARETRRGDLEVARPQLGRLEIYYYKQDDGRVGQKDEPVVSHFKLTEVDNRFVVFGSGNMDRASWYTSQELGLLIYTSGDDIDGWTLPLRTRMERHYPPLSA